MLACSTLALACGGGGNAVNGTVSGTAIASVAGAISVLIPSEFGSTGQDLWVSLSDFASVCEAHAAQKTPKDSKTLFIGLHQFGSDNKGVDLSPGTFNAQFNFTPSEGRHAEVYLGNFSGPNCGDTLATNGQATGGTVTLTRVDANGAAGSFNITFPAGTMTGTFSTVNCTGGNPQFGGTCYP
jgi:hypothetical protein